MTRASTTDALQRDQRRRLTDLFEAAVGAVRAATLLPAHLAEITAARVHVIAVGKAAGDMMRVALESGPPVARGLLVTPAGGLPPDFTFPANIEIIIAGHPTPDAESVRAAEHALALAGALSADDHLLVLLSGGGSALMAAPAAGLTLADKQGITRALLRSGAPIADINGVRKHLSRIKGGRLARAAGEAAVTTLILSDIPGDDLALVASGPTLPDASSLSDARAALARNGVTPAPVIAAALTDPANESPTAEDLNLSRHHTRIISRARDALDAAGALAERRGWAVVDLGDDLEGEAREVAIEHARLALDLAASGRPMALISGGETTVTVTNPDGRGGRNLEYLLSLAIALDGAQDITALACDTDGIDGASPAAGGMIFPDTLARASASGLDAKALLDQNNALVFFEALGDLVVTGPTRTNVNDFRVILIGDPS